MIICSQSGRKLELVTHPTNSLVVERYRTLNEDSVCPAAVAKAVTFETAAIWLPDLGQAKRILSLTGVATGKQVPAGFLRSNSGRCQPVAWLPLVA